MHALFITPATGRWSFGGRFDPVRKNERGDQIPLCMCDKKSTPSIAIDTISRRHLLRNALFISLLTKEKSVFAAASSSGAHVTDRVFIDLKVAGTPKGRIVFGLFGEEAPESVSTFLRVIKGELRGRGGRVATYQYSVGTKVLHGKYVELGRLNQIDAVNQSPGTPQRQQIAVPAPENGESNDLQHDAFGTLSVKRGGGRFEFDVALGKCEQLDQENIVIGRVVEGNDILEMLGNIPTNQKTPRDGFRAVGKVIGDTRAKVDLEDKPLRKIQIYNCGVL